MDARSLKRLLPQNKDDADGAKALVALGYPAVAPVMPQMLDWLKSNGSPVELVICEFFASLSAHAVPVEQKALASRHHGIKYSVVKNVVSRWPNTDVLSDVDNPKAQCFKGSYRGVETKIPPFLPFILQLSMG